MIPAFRKSLAALFVVAVSSVAVLSAIDTVSGQMWPPLECTRHETGDYCGRPNHCIFWCPNFYYPEDPDPGCYPDDFVGPLPPGAEHC